MKIKVILYVFLAIIIIVAAYLLIKGFTKKEENQITEYIPQEEISEVQERQTLVTLYFQNKENKNIMPEARMIDVKELLINPYKTLVNLLLEGPKNDKLQKLIPEGTALIDANIEGNTAILNFSKEFVQGVKLGKEQEEKIINSIVNTLTELSEIDDVKIKIEGKDGECFEDKEVDFINNFTRKN